MWSRLGWLFDQDFVSYSHRNTSACRPTKTLTRQSRRSRRLTVRRCTSIEGGSAFDTRLVLYDISQLLNTQLDKETLATCVHMIESGVNPEALAVSSAILLKSHVFLNDCSTVLQAVIIELRREKAALATQ